MSTMIIVLEIFVNGNIKVKWEQRTKIVLSNNCDI